MTTASRFVPHRPRFVPQGPRFGSFASRLVRHGALFQRSRAPPGRSESFVASSGLCVVRAERRFARSKLRPHRDESRFVPAKLRSSVDRPHLAAAKRSPLSPGARSRPGSVPSKQATQPLPQERAAGVWALPEATPDRPRPTPAREPTEVLSAQERDRDLGQSPANRLPNPSLKSGRRPRRAAQLAHLRRFH